MKPYMSCSMRALTSMVFTASMALPSALMAQEIQLTSSDGTVNMTGDFVAFEDNAYIISTPLGQLRVSATRVSCSGEACPQLGEASADFLIAGSDTVGLGLMPLIIEGYAGAKGAEATIGNTSTQGEILATFVGDQGFGEEIGSYLVSSTSSGDAFTALQGAEAQIGMSSRRIREGEARELAADGAGDMFSPSQEHIVAVDSLVVITHPSNPVSELTTDQLRSIYNGRVQNWSQVGGPNLPIKVVSRQVGSGTRAVFEQRIFGSNVPPLAPGAVIAEDNAIASQIVNSDPAAIAVTGFAFQRGAQALTLVNECGIRMAPEPFAARTEEYALQRRLYLYTRADDQDAETQEFIDFATSPEADNLISKAGFIGLDIARRAQLPGDPRGVALRQLPGDNYIASFMQNMYETMVDYDRLSTTFRFVTGSSELDERGSVDKDRLVEYLTQQPAGTEVLVVGFTDEVGAFDFNLGLAEARASKVAQAIAEKGGSRLGNVAISSIGYGEVSPAACNSSEDGRRINRRVEIWIRNAA